MKNMGDIKTETNLTRAKLLNEWTWICTKHNSRMDLTIELTHISMYYMLKVDPAIST